MAAAAGRHGQDDRLIALWGRIPHDLPGPSQSHAAVDRVACVPASMPVCTSRALAQDLLDVAYREDMKKRRDLCFSKKLGSFPFVECRYFIERRIEFRGQRCDNLPVIGVLVRSGHRRFLS